MEDNILPVDHKEATLVGRVWDPAANGPSVVVVRDGLVVDISQCIATMSNLLDSDDPLADIAKAKGKPMGMVTDIARNSLVDQRDKSLPWLLAPVDLQALKAAGVTFIASLLERVIEEKAGGDPGKAGLLRTELESLIGDSLSGIKPGSPSALKLKSELVNRGMWSQYLEVGIGPDAEIFTKGQPLSAVGWGADIGILPSSRWNNPEPEVALLVNNRGEVVGATLANDVNLRDYEGRSALLLGKAKDNNAACAVGPFVRLFDRGFELNDVRQMEIDLLIKGEDDFHLQGSSSMEEISRDPLDLVFQAINPNHQYPDGLLLLLGTMFAPTEDRDEPGLGFTHKLGDRVVIAAEKLGRLENTVRLSHQCDPWTMGVGALMKNLAGRGLLGTPEDFNPVDII